MVVRRAFPQIYELDHPKTGRSWMVSARSKKWGLNERKFFSTKELAISHAKGIEDQLVKFGKEPEVPKEKLIWAERYEKLAEKVGTFGMSVEEAVEQLMRHKGDEIVRGTKPFIRDLADSWETFKLADTTLSERYLSEIHSYAIFIKRKWGGLKPDEIKRNDIDLLLKKLKISNNTRRKYRLYIHMFFSWVVNEGHILKNPTDGISFKPDDFNGDFYTPDETSKFLRYIVEHHKDLAGYFALLIFAGLRPTEGKRVQWQDYSPKLSGLCIYP